ncbi:MAG: hypothetical protein HRU70_05055 [Phycisphaeraceae bacterium]|nr:MAG: hypothetical protein HRU70_05055 [Phycisphaeraceae bacterium]
MQEIRPTVLLVVDLSEGRERLVAIEYGAEGSTRRRVSEFEDHRAIPEAGGAMMPFREQSWFVDSSGARSEGAVSSLESFEVVDRVDDARFTVDLGRAHQHFSATGEVRDVEGKTVGWVRSARPWWGVGWPAVGLCVAGAAFTGALGVWLYRRRAA